ncbi:MAG TPA: malate dehydrogenase [Rhodospirillales bacterium]|nr:malate dehydrogenase [Rhodospirillales bacterium]
MSQEESPTVFVPLDDVLETVTRVFSKRGCSIGEAQRVASRLAGANLRGHDSHGIIRVPRYVLSLESGFFQPDQTVKIETENDVMAVVDGRFGFGQTVGEQAVDIGVAKAHKYGVSITALRNAGHLGRIGDWAERAAYEGLISIHVANIRGSQLVAPFGGRERRYSTSPFCVGIPMPDEEPVILDFATSSVAEGKALVAFQADKSLPEGTFVDEWGEMSGDPLSLYGVQSEGIMPNANSGPGALRTFGEHKGSGLNFIIELLAGALTGSGVPTEPVDPTNRKVWNGMLSIFLSPNFFRSNNEFAGDVRSFIEFVKSSTPDANNNEVLVPGEKERHIMAERSETGLPLPEKLWLGICELSY